MQAMIQTMNTVSSKSCLILHPVDPNWIPTDINNVTTCLRDIGLISDEIHISNHNDRGQRFLAGDKFLDLIMFMGCSPAINFTPEAGPGKFSFIRLMTIPNTIAALTSGITRSPHCPACNKIEKDWHSKIAITELECSACGKSSLPWHYNWRKSAGFGRFFIEITEIYPKEAIPQQGLLDQLRDGLGTNWQYFYYYN